MDTISDLRVKFNISQNAAIGITRYFHKKFQIPQAKYLYRDIVAKNLQFSTLFEVGFEDKFPTVWCTDAQAFIDRIMLMRSMNPERSLVMLNIDKGDDTIKVSFTLLDTDENGIPQPKPVGRGGFLSSGVKNLLLLGVVAGGDENYDIVNRLMKMLPFSQPRKFVVDHKMKNSALGISMGIHWCDVCNYDRNNGDDYDETKVDLRTFEMCRQLNRDYVAAGMYASVRVCVLHACSA